MHRYKYLEILYDIILVHVINFMIYSDVSTLQFLQKYYISSLMTYWVTVGAYCLHYFVSPDLLTHKWSNNIHRTKLSQSPKKMQ